MKKDLITEWKPKVTFESLVKLMIERALK